MHISMYDHEQIPIHPRVIEVIASPDGILNSD